MRRVLLLLLGIIIVNISAHTQSRRSIRVRAGEDIAQAYSPHGFYSFPAFSKATLFFRSGGNNSGLLFNYNILGNSLQFIGPAGDTLEAANTSSLDSVVFEKTHFYNAEGLAEMAASAGNLKLLKRISIKLQAENIGAYGQPNPTSSIVNYNTFYSGINVYNLSINQDIVIVETTSWYLMDEKLQFRKASRQVLLEMLQGEFKSRAQRILGGRKVNFDKPADLLQLFEELKD
jgi:hypothetical protein